MARKSRVVLRVYRQDFEDERGKWQAYRLRVFGAGTGAHGRLNRMLLCDIVKRSIQGVADEDNLIYHVWQTTSKDDFEEFAAAMEKWSPLQRAAYDSVLESMTVGPSITPLECLDRVSHFVDGYEEGYKQAQRDWGLPVKSALYPEEGPK